MECPQKSGDGMELIIAYAARALDRETQIAVERHLEGCATCAEMAAAQRAVWSTLDELTPLPVSSNFDERLYQRIARENERRWWQRWFAPDWSWRSAFPVAAACAVLVVAFLVQHPGRDAALPSPPQPKVQIEQVERALDDMDMLKQVGVEPVAETSGPRERI